MKINKIIGLCIILLITIININAIDSNGLTAYYSFANGINDDFASFDLIENISTTEVTGILDNARNYSGAEISYNTDINISGNEDFSINMWLKSSTPSYYYALFNNDANSYTSYYYQSSTQIYDIWRVGGSSSGSVLSGFSFNHNVWTMITLVYDNSATNCLLYQNGAFITTKTDCVDGIGTLDLYLGSTNVITSSYAGVIDEVSVWNNSLTSLNISDLWNSGEGYNPLSNATDNISVKSITVNGEELVNNSVYYTNELLFYLELDPITSDEVIDFSDLSVSLDEGVEDFAATYDSEKGGFFLFGGDRTTASFDFIRFYNKTSNTYDNNYGLLPYGYYMGQEGCINRINTTQHYCYGGYRTQNLSLMNHIMEYDSNTNISSFINISLPTGVYDTSVVYDSLRDKAYIFGGYDAATAQDTIYIHDFTTHTITNSTTSLTEKLLLMGSWYNTKEDYVVLTGGTKWDGSWGYYPKTQIYYPSNDTIVELLNTSNLPYGADSLNCEYMPSNNNSYCFGSVSSSLFAPYIYRDDILQWTNSNKIWSVTPYNILDAADDFPATLDTDTNEDIYLFGVMQAGSSDNDVTKMTETELLNIVGGTIINQVANVSYILNNETPIQFITDDYQGNFMLDLNISTNEIYFYIINSETSSYTQNYTFNITNTCTPPAINNNWIIDSADNCIISDDDIDLGTGSIFFTGDGSITFDNVNLSTLLFERESGDGGINTQVYLYNTICMLI